MGDKDPILRRIATTTVATGLSLGAIVACGGGSDVDTLPNRAGEYSSTSDDKANNTTTTEAREGGVDSSSTVSSEVSDIGTSEEVNSLEDEQQAAVVELVESGYSLEDAIEFIKAVSLAPLYDVDNCIVRVADAKGGEDNAFSGNWLLKTESGETIINVSQFATAGEGVIENNGPNLFFDSVGPDYQEGVQTREEVAAYFGDQNHVEERTEEARDERYARLCGDPYELASAMVVAANAKLGNTQTRLGDINEFLTPYLVSHDRTAEEMTEAIQKAVDTYVIEYPEGVDSASEITEYIEGLSEEDQQPYLDAYENQLKDAAQLITIFERLPNYINTKQSQVEESTVSLLGLTKAGYAKLAFSNLGIDTSEDGALGGKYSAEAGSIMTLFGNAKAGCITLDGIVVNLLDGRYGYAVVEIPGCEPIVVPSSTIPNRATSTTTPTQSTTTSSSTTSTSSTTTTLAPKVQVPVLVSSVVIAGQGAGGEADDDKNPDNNVTTSIATTTTAASSTSEAPTTTAAANSVTSTTLGSVVVD